MILVLAFIAGFVFGWRRAAQRNGSRADRIQYGLAHGLAFLVGAAMLALIAALAGYSPL